jgi:hypothetical protein
MKATTTIVAYAVILIIVSIVVMDFTHLMEAFAARSTGTLNFTPASDVASGRSMSSILGAKN